MEFSIIGISALVGVLNEAIKKVFKDCFDVDISKYIPIFSIVFGLILGIVGYFMPSVVMGNNIVEAIFIGISSGSAATGVHQVGKQMSQNNSSE